MKKLRNSDSNIAGSFYSTRHGKVLEDLVYYSCGLCGNEIKKEISYASFSKICTFPKIEEYEELKCPYCGELLNIKKIKRTLSKSNEVIEYNEIRKNIND